MSSSRRPGAAEDSILASLERSPSGARAHRSWLIIGGSAAAILTAMIAWLAYGNATSVRTMPQSAVTRAVAPPPDNSTLTQSVPSISVQAPQAAAIVDEAPAERPALVMLPRQQIEGARPAPEVREPVAASSKPAIARTGAAGPKQLATPAKVAAPKPAAHAAPPKKAKSVPAAAAPSEIDSDVALLSAIVAHSTRHAAERAQQDSCQGKKCPPKASAQP